jgi:hypothetical protein
MMILFAQHISTVLTALLGDLVSDHVYAQSAPDNFDFKNNDLIVHLHRIEGSEETLENVRDYNEYMVSINILSESGEKTSSIGDQAVSRFEYWSDGRIADTSFEDDQNDYDLETGIYLRTLNFKCIYKN